MSTLKPRTPDRIMNSNCQNMAESGALARGLSGRYGSLALARAAGAAWEAQRRGDEGRVALFRGALDDLRQTIAVQSP
jgi:hypothetical protein